jgi:Fic family protein
MRRITYIHQRSDWPRFTWNHEKLGPMLAHVRHRQGRLIGRMEGLGFVNQNEAVLATLTQDVLKSSEIEGEILNPDQVRSSIARRLGIDIAGAIPAAVAKTGDIEGVVEMMLDATQHFADPLTQERLFGWHAALFPTGYGGIHPIRIGAWRDDSKGAMQVISGPISREKVHFEAPAAKRLQQEMDAFLAWANSANNPNSNEAIDPVLKAAVAHLWFVTIHPFDDGNGRIARAIADWALARSEGSSQRFYSMSSQIRAERSAYYDMLEHTQKSSLDITDWIEWFLACLDRAITATETTLGAVFRKATFWDKHSGGAINERQKKMLNKLFDAFEGKLTSAKWAVIAKCSQDTAQRDIQGLIDQGILVKDSAGGRSTSYSLGAF